MTTYQVDEWVTPTLHPELEMAVGKQVHGASAISEANFRVGRVYTLTTAREEEEALEAYRMNMIRTGRRPDGGGTGTVEEESPVGDCLLPLLLCAMVYCVWRSRRGLLPAIKRLFTKK